MRRVPRRLTLQLSSVSHSSRIVLSSYTAPLSNLPEACIPSTAVGTHGRANHCSMERPSKKVKVSPDSNIADSSQLSTASATLASLHRSITPPPKTRSRHSPAADAACSDPSKTHSESQRNGSNPAHSQNPSPRVIPSPIQLTHIKDLPDQRGLNVDTVRLRDILGDPMIRECWQFNYLFDVDFLMSQFDEDVRSLVQVKVVHGSWEKEAANRIRVDVSFLSITWL